MGPGVASCFPTASGACLCTFLVSSWRLPEGDGCETVAETFVKACAYAAVQTIPRTTLWNSKSPYQPCTRNAAWTTHEAAQSVHCYTQSYTAQKTHTCHPAFCAYASTFPALACQQGNSDNSQRPQAHKHIPCQKESFTTLKAFQTPLLAAAGVLGLYRHCFHM